MAMMRWCGLAVNEHDVTARVFSHAVPKLGSDVWLTVEGGVVAYPEPILA